MIKFAQIVKNGSLWIFQGTAEDNEGNPITFSQIGGHKAGAISIGEAWIKGLGRKLDIDVSDISIMEKGAEPEEVDISEELEAIKQEEAGPLDIEDITEAAEATEDNSEVSLGDDSPIADLDLDVDGDPADGMDVIEDTLGDTLEQIDVSEISSSEEQYYAESDSIVSTDEGAMDFGKVREESVEEFQLVVEDPGDPEHSTPMMPGIDPELEDCEAVETVEFEMAIWSHPRDLKHELAPSDNLKKTGYISAVTFVLEDRVHLEFVVPELDDDHRLARYDGDEVKTIAVKPGAFDKSWKAPSNDNGLFEFWLQPVA